MWVVVYHSRFRIAVCRGAPRRKTQISMHHNNHGSVHADKLQKSSLVLDDTNKQHKVQAVQACGLLCTIVAFGSRFQTFYESRFESFRIIFAPNCKWFGMIRIIKCIFCFLIRISDSESRFHQIEPFYQALIQNRTWNRRHLSVRPLSATLLYEPSSKWTAGKRLYFIRLWF